MRNGHIGFYNAFTTKSKLEYGLDQRRDLLDGIRNGRLARAWEWEWGVKFTPKFRLILGIGRVVPDRRPAVFDVHVTCTLSHLLA